MNYQKTGDKAKLPYDQSYSKKYRKSDELAIHAESHNRMCNILNETTRSFDQKITALDVGCGTGRYFHCLKNIQSLVGIDVSPSMLKEACNPVLQEKIAIEQIDLSCGNILEVNLSGHSFDFIYSIGVLGEHSPFDSFICNKVYGLLKKNGKFFFTVVDITSKMQLKSFKRRIAESICPLLPAVFKERLQERWKSFYMTYKELQEIMENCMFARYEINRHVSTSPRWNGAHYECTAIKKEP